MYVYECVNICVFMAVFECVVVGVGVGVCMVLLVKV